MSLDTTRDTTLGRHTRIRLRRHTRIRGHIGDDPGFDICLQSSVKVPLSQEDLLVYSFSLALNWRDSSGVDLISIYCSCHVFHISGTLAIFISLIRSVVGPQS